MEGPVAKRTRSGKRPATGRVTARDAEWYLERTDRRGRTTALNPAGLLSVGPRLRPVFSSRDLGDGEGGGSVARSIKTLDPVEEVRRAVGLLEKGQHSEVDHEALGRSIVVLAQARWENREIVLIWPRPKSRPDPADAGCSLARLFAAAMKSDPAAPTIRKQRTQVKQELQGHLDAADQKLEAHLRQIEKVEQQARRRRVTFQGRMSAILRREAEALGNTGCAAAAYVTAELIALERIRTTGATTRARRRALGLVTDRTRRRKRPHEPA
jgi:hypothetical protein